MNITNNKDLIRASLFGFFIGDALGVPVEFLNRNILKEYKVTDMQEYGTHNQPKGTWSDDSSMVLATIDGLLKSKMPSIEYQKIMINFLEWKQSGKFTPFECVFDIGNVTSSALYQYQQNIENNNPEDVICGSGNFNSNGNGSLMRILPISLYLYYLGIDYSEEKALEIIKIISGMTHSHIYSITGCLIYTIFVIELLKGNDKSKAYLNLRKFLKSICKDKSELKDIKKIYGKVIYKDISKLKENDIKSSGYVVDTLEATIWAILTTNTFEEAVLKAINLGNDTDTIGALTGALAGIIYGYASIPVKWINNLQKKYYLDEMVESFIIYLENLKESNTKISSRILGDTIYDLKNNPNACTLVGGTVSSDKHYIMPSSMPGKQLSEFIDYIYEKDLIDKNYMKNSEIIKNKKIKDMTYDEVITQITFILRGERFCGGLLYSNFKDGTMLKLLERLNELYILMMELP